MDRYDELYDSWNDYERDVKYRGVCSTCEHIIDDLEQDKNKIYIVTKGN